MAKKNETWTFRPDADVSELLAEQLELIKREDGNSDRLRSRLINAALRIALRKRPKAVARNIFKRAA